MSFNTFPSTNPYLPINSPATDSNNPPVTWEMVLDNLCFVEAYHKADRYKIHDDSQYTFDKDNEYLCKHLQEDIRTKCGTCLDTTNVSTCNNQHEFDLLYKEPETMTCLDIGQFLTDIYINNQVKLGETESTADPGVRTETNVTRQNNLMNALTEYSKEAGNTACKCAPQWTFWVGGTTPTDFQKCDDRVDENKPWCYTAGDCSGATEADSANQLTPDGKAQTHWKYCSVLHEGNN